MKIYGEYCLNYETNLNELIDIAANDKTLETWIKVKKNFFFFHFFFVNSL